MVHPTRKRKAPTLPGEISDEEVVQQQQPQNKTAKVNKDKKAPKVPKPKAGGAKTKVNTDKKVPKGKASGGATSRASKAKKRKDDEQEDAGEMDPNRSEDESSAEIRFNLDRTKTCHEDFLELMDALQAFFDRYKTEKDSAGREGLLCSLDETKNSMDRLLDAREGCKSLPNLAKDDPRLLEINDKVKDGHLAYMTLRYDILKETKTTEETEAAPSITGSVQQVLPPMYYPYYDPKKDGITFSGTDSRDYASFLIGWKTVEAEFEKRGKPRIELFRQLKKCLSGDPRDLVKDIAETDDAVDAAFEILNEYYLQPLDGILGTYKTLIGGEDGLIGSSHESCWKMYKRSITAEKSNELFNLNAETEATLLLIAAATKNFKPDMEIKFKKYLLEHCYDPESPLQYKITRKTMGQFFQYCLKTTQKKPAEGTKKTEAKEWESSSSSNNGSKFFKKSSAAATFTTTTANKCRFCHRTGHQVKDCYKFKSSSPGEILKYTSELKLCRACFEPFSSRHQCQVQCQVNGCGRRHLTQLHEVALEHERRYEKGGPRTSGGFAQQRSNHPSFGGTVHKKTSTFTPGANPVGQGPSSRK